MDTATNFATPSFTHLALHVQDLQACIDFYRGFCGLTLVHERGEGDSRVVWIAQPGQEKQFVFVLLSGGPGSQREANDYGHLGFACASRKEVDAIAQKAKERKLLIWPPREEPYPVGYYCGVRDPEGNVVEFSYGQPLGPGAESA